MDKNLFGPDDFRSMRYDVINIKSGVLESVPKLRKLKSFVDCDAGIRDKAIKLCVLFYDKNSPVARVFKDLDIRYREAAKIAGFDLVKDKALLESMYNFTPKVLQIDDLGNPTETQPCFFENMAMEYLADQGDLYLFLIHSNEKTFFEFQKAAQQVVELFNSDKDKLGAISIKGKLLEESHKIAERLETYYAKVYGEGEISRKVKLRNFSPESIAKGV